jgi:hypothetical protein
MANWRDTFKSKTSDNERKIRLAAEQGAQAQTQYAAINRLDVTSANKQVTSRKLLDAINSDGPAKYEALGIVRILINFKFNEKKGGDANQAIAALADLERHAKVIPSLTAQELMEFVKNRSAFFQRQIPETFKQLLLSIMPSNINALVTAENGSFLISNGVINDQQLATVVNRQNVDDHPPLEKIRTLFDLIDRTVPKKTFIAMSIPGAIIQSFKDGFRKGIYNNHPEAVTHLKNLLNIYISGSENQSARLRDRRFNKLGAALVTLPDKSQLKYSKAYFADANLSSIKQLAIAEIIGAISTNYTGADKSQLIDWLKSVEKNSFAQPLNPFGPDYNRTWAYQKEVVGNKTQQGVAIYKNNRSAYAASRKSADLSNGLQFDGNQGNIVPESINIVAQSGFSMGMDESALVVFAANQSVTNTLALSWSKGPLFYVTKIVNWDIQMLLSEILPELYGKPGGLFESAADTEIGEQPKEATLSQKDEGIQYDFTRYKERIVRYKVGNLFIWKNKHRFYETIEADVRITWNFHANYVHYEILNTIRHLTLHPLIFPRNDPHIPKNTSTRYGF